MKESLRAIIEADKNAREKIENIKKKLDQSEFSLSQEQKDLDAFYEKDSAEKIAALEKAHKNSVANAEKACDAAIESAKNEAHLMTGEKKEFLIQKLFEEITR